MPVDRNYRPPPTGNPVVDVAFRQILDHIYDQRNNYGPTNVFGKGAPTAAVVTVPSAAASKPATGIGVTVTLDRPGNWLLTAAVALTITGDHGQIFTVSLTAGGVAQAPFSQWSQGADGMVVIHQTWQYASVKGGTQVQLRIIKDGGAGTSAVNPVNSTLSALWQGPIG